MIAWNPSVTPPTALSRSIALGSKVVIRPTFRAKDIANATRNTRRLPNMSEIMPAGMTKSPWLSQLSEVTRATNLASKPAASR